MLVDDKKVEEVLGQHTEPEILCAALRILANHHDTLMREGFANVHDYKRDDITWIEDGIQGIQRAAWTLYRHRLYFRE